MALRIAQPASAACPHTRHTSHRHSHVMLKPTPLTITFVRHAGCHTHLHTHHRRATCMTNVICTLNMI